MTFSPGSNLNYAFKNHVYLRHKKEGHANNTSLRKKGTFDYGSSISNFGCIFHSQTKSFVIKQYQ